MAVASENAQISITVSNALLMGIQRLASIKSLKRASLMSELVIHGFFEAVDSELNESINRYKNDCDRLGIDPVIAEDEIRGHIDEDNQASDEEKVDKAMLKLKYVSLLNEKSEELKSASDQHAVDSVDHMRLLTNKQFDVAREEGRLGKTKSQIATVDAMITNLKHWRDELAESY